MSTLLKEIFEVNALRLAHEFLATYTLDEAAALKQLKAALLYMEEWEVRRWMEYLGALVVEEEVTAAQLHLLLAALEALEPYRDGVASTAHLLPVIGAPA